MPILIQPPRPVVIREPMRPRFTAPVVSTPVAVPVAPRAPVPPTPTLRDMMRATPGGPRGFDELAAMMMAMGGER